MKPTLDGFLRPVVVANAETGAEGGGLVKAWEFINSAGRVVPCAWCQGELGVTPTRVESHGICPRHQAEFLTGLSGVRGTALGRLGGVESVDMERQAVPSARELGAGL